MQNFQISSRWLSWQQDVVGVNLKDITILPDPDNKKFGENCVQVFFYSDRVMPL